MERVRFQLGCLERWYFISFGQEDRDGFGSGRGIRGDWTVQLTPMGAAAVENWPPLFGVIDERWRARFGDRHVERLVTALQGITGVQAGLAESLMLALRRVAEEFNPQSPLPIELCANTIRVLGEESVPVSELARLTGVARAGGDAPALGRRTMAAVALQRGRDVVAQNRNFVRDPAGCLPHYPIWDMNRGFGP
jgi:hypothetical protein